MADFVSKNFTVLLQKNHGSEVIAAYESEFKGYQNFQIRQMFKDSAGNWRPCKEGFSVPMRDRDALIDAIAALKGPR